MFSLDLQTRLMTPNEHPAPNHVVPPERRFIRHTSASGFVSGLRLPFAGSPQHTAESGSSSYGLLFRLRLLPTPPRDDAVTFSYGAVANSDRDLHPANGTPSRAYTKPLAVGELRSTREED